MTESFWSLLLYGSGVPTVRAVRYSKHLVCRGNETDMPKIHWKKSEKKKLPFLVGDVDDPYPGPAQCEEGWGGGGGGFCYRSQLLEWVRETTA